MPEGSREELPSSPPCESQGTEPAGLLAPRSSRTMVTGGGGYLGYNLGCALVSSGIAVVLFDLRKPKWEIPRGADFFKGDVRDYEAVFKACEGVDCVFHVAACGMSGLEQLQKKDQIESINVGGTKVIIDVCKQRNIPRLIYTSTVNVVFGGKPIEEGDEETVPYFPLEKQFNHYSRTKAIADQMVLAANGTLLKGGDKLHTCVLRPPGIYGPEEQRHLPRVAINIQRRLFNFKFGNHKVQMNWVHIGNLVQAHLLAAEALTSEKGYVASGQAYYIHDGENVIFSEWIVPLFEKLGYRKPWIHIPVLLAHIAATVMEYLHLILKPVFSFTPFLTRNEVWNVTVTHTFRIDKARNQLGYKPKKFSFADSVDHYLKTRPTCQEDHTFLKMVSHKFCISMSHVLPPTVQPAGRRWCFLPEQPVQQVPQCDRSPHYCQDALVQQSQLCEDTRRTPGMLRAAWTPCEEQSARKAVRSQMSGTQGFCGAGGCAGMSGMLRGPCGGCCGALPEPGPNGPNGAARGSARGRGSAGARAEHGALRCRPAALQTDIRDYSAVLAVCEGADCVFHVASYGMSGTEQLHKKEIESVNISGTRLILNACRKKNVPRLVYTSSVNVVFGGLPIEDGDEESLAYFPIDKLVDHYSRTKSIAEQMVLAADGVSLEGGGILHTCVLRPPGIYGPEEQRHLPRLAKIIERRLLSFKFGDPSVQMNWIHVENFVQAHILAAQALTPQKNYIASGQVYFIHDGEKSNLFEWLTPLFEGLGCSKPWIRIPTCVVYASATFMEHLHALLRPVVDLPPLLTRNEVQNISVTHTFRIDKARAQLGYRPQKFDFADSVNHYLESRPRSYYKLFLNIFLALFVTLILAFIFTQLGGLSILRFFKGRKH
ncbi:putative short-chain dehydrogenase/reductase family 42E member 2 [Ammospiza maritima maritima]